MRQIFCILVILLPVSVFSQSKKSVRINEIMADPKGQVVFPETEYVELYNKTDEAVSLGGWNFSYGGKTTTLTDVSLPAHGYGVLYRAGRDIHVDAPGVRIPLDKFPSQLANTGKEVALYDASGTLIDAIAYEKSSPGVSWERVGNEFFLSEDERGGTPGSVNSIPDTSTPDTPPDKPDLPRLTTVQPLSQTEFRLEYDKPVYIGDATFTIREVGQASRVSYADELGKASVNLRFGQALEIGVEYILYCEGLTDLQGNTMPDDTFPILLEYGEEPEEPDTPEEPNDPDIPDEPEQPVIPDDSAILPGEIVFNELLPNPFPEGSEYIELYNRSGRGLSLPGLAIATRKADGRLGTCYPLSSLSSPLEPGGFIVLTKRVAGVTPYYLISSPEVLHELKLPVLANTSATLVLFRTEDETVIDEVCYSSQWHASSVKDEKGVSLERIDPDGDSREASNWTSASATAGYGTPGYRNSQFSSASGGSTGIDSPVFSDITREYTIAYHLDQPGYTCRAWVYDTAGRRVSEIANHDLLGTEGALVWNGLMASGRPVKMGIYMIYVELTHPEGRVKRQKEVFLVR